MEVTEDIIATAALLSTKAAGLICDDPIPVQLSVLWMVRNVIDYWEQMGITLDPVEFSAVVDSVVIVARSYAIALTIIEAA